MASRVAFPLLIYIFLSTLHLAFGRPSQIHRRNTTELTAGAFNLGCAPIGSKIPEQNALPCMLEILIDMMVDQSLVHNAIINNGFITNRCGVLYITILFHDTQRLSALPELEVRIVENFVIAMQFLWLFTSNGEVPETTCGLRRFQQKILEMHVWAFDEDQHMLAGSSNSSRRSDNVTSLESLSRRSGARKANNMPIHSLVRRNTTSVDTMPQRGSQPAYKMTVGDLAGAGTFRYRDLFYILAEFVRSVGQEGLPGLEKHYLVDGNICRLSYRPTPLGIGRLIAPVVLSSLRDALDYITVTAMGLHRLYRGLRLSIMFLPPAGGLAQLFGTIEVFGSFDPLEGGGEVGMVGSNDTAVSSS